ncbi:hypothetical protein B7P43_G11746 [Cryptotermes secundus]|uniref:Tc1-like transposase DDE domain-containing protein n=1 Tax=Cryptotermes secundus TaxID=105785 RepID=A0A2J7QB63_9NEOP|nr:hypothetical protein B7P43_G11746 [Cryptotermes secundus]
MKVEQEIYRMLQEEKSVFLEVTVSVILSKKLYMYMCPIPNSFRDRAIAYIVQEFLAKNKMAVVPHPPYSPDLAPCDFFLFPKMKIKLKGRRFDTVEEIQVETQTVLNTLTKKDFQDAFEKWQKCWDRCMRSQGDYFEGDGAE